MSGQTRVGRHDNHITDGQHRIEAMIDCLAAEQIEWEVDVPNDPKGEWWVDIVFDGFSTNVAWRHDRGFGVYTSNDDAFGARPDEIYREPELAAKRLLQLAMRAKGDEAAMRLSEVRKLVDKSQTLVAKHLCRDQGFVSKLEHRNDAMLSTIKAYVEALGGKVWVMVRFDGFEAAVDLPPAGKCNVPGKSRAQRVGKGATSHATIHATIHSIEDLSPK